MLLLVLVLLWVVWVSLLLMRLRVLELWVWIVPQLLLYKVWLGVLRFQMFLKVFGVLGGQSRDGGTPPTHKTTALGASIMCRWGCVVRGGRDRALGASVWVQ